jgi:hypothetical protein
VYRHGLFGYLKVDGRAEFKGVVIQELNKLGINRIVILAYNSTWTLANYLSAYYINNR